MTDIRPARPDECVAIGELTVAAYRSAGFLSGDSGYAASLADVAGRMAGATVLVALLDGRLAGTATYIDSPAAPVAELVRDGEAEMRMLAVDPLLQGKGVGRELVLECVRRAASAALTRIVLSSRPDMAAAHHVYERLGFRRTPAADWSAAPGIELITFALELGEPETTLRQPGRGDAVRP